MKDTPLTLVSFAPEPSCSTVNRILIDLGYRVQPLGTARQVGACFDKLKGIAVFLFGRPDDSQERILSLLARARKTPSFGIFVTPESEWDPEIVDYCDEFSSWPCPNRELELRLQRLRERSPHSIEENQDAELLDELIKMNMVGRSSSFIATIQRMKKFARWDAQVLIEGETGTGKELMARAIHYLGNRRDYPFIPVNCGALPENLLENELFGHGRGAYTDAKTDHTGVIAQSEGGTLFLDEVEALTPKGQVALLRFLEGGEYRPLGGSRIVKANVRVVAACNIPLDDLVRQGMFRRDLQFRLNIMPVTLPPLRERFGDAELLAEHFLSDLRRQYCEPEKYLHRRSLSFLRSYRWPGNVRELENLVHREFLLSESPEILFESAGGSTSDAPLDQEKLVSDHYLDCSFSEAKTNVVQEFEQHYLSHLMQEFHGNVTRAARRAGKERRALGKLLKKYGIDKSRFA